MVTQLWCVLGGNHSDTFGVTIGVKQGCVLVPVLSNVFLLEVSLFTVWHAQTQRRLACARLRYRCDGGAFRLKRLKALRPTQQLVVRDLQCAEDEAIVARDSRGLQEELTLSDA